MDRGFPTGRVPAIDGSASLRPEVRLLLALDDPQRLAHLASRCDWSVADRLAREQRLTGRLLRSLDAAAARDAVPPDLAAAWRARSRHAAATYRDALRQIERLAEALTARAATPCLLKGPVLVLLGCSAPGERPFGDLDLLVPGDRLDQASAAMRELGYHQRIDARRRQWARLTHYHDPRWYHPEERFPVEVHWDIARPHQPLAFAVETLSRVTLHLPSGACLERLDDVDLLGHACMHFWGDRAAGKPNGLGQLWDVADLTERLDDASWAEFWRRAEQRGHTNVLATVLATVRVLLYRPELERFPAIAARAATTELLDFAARRVCARRPAHVQLLSPFDDVHFGVGRLLRQNLPWAYTQQSPLRWWPSVVFTRVSAAAFRSGRALGEIYGVQPSLRLRISFLWELGKLLGRGFRQPRSTVAELRIDRWAVRMTRNLPRGHAGRRQRR